MKLAIKLFGPLADAAGAHTIQIDVPAAPSADGLIQHIGRTYPTLQPMLAGTRLAINHGFAQASDTVKESDELALITMVSGG